MELHSQQFIVFINYKWAQKACELYNIRVDKLTRDKHSSLLCPFIIYEEKVVL